MKGHEPLAARFMALSGIGNVCCQGDLPQTFLVRPGGGWENCLYGFLVCIVFLDYGSGLNDVFYESFYRFVLRFFWKCVLLKEDSRYLLTLRDGRYLA